MGLEKTLEKLDNSIDQLNDIKNHNSLINKAKKLAYLFYIVDVGGTLLPKYQRRYTQRLGWKEKNLTLANATFCGIAPSLLYFGGNYFFGDDIAGKTFQDVSYSYPGFMFGQSILRTALSQITKKPMAAISIIGIFGNIGYTIADFVKKKKACEGS